VEFHSVPHSGVLVIEVRGRLDSTTCDALEAEVRRQREAGHARIVFDLGALEYISSAGMQVLMGAAREVRGDGSVALAAPMPQVKHVLDVARMETFAPTYDTAAQAVEALAR
jgi:anti-sigma B factor antagonist